jgi:hypothetical protein
VRSLLAKLAIFAALLTVAMLTATDWRRFDYWVYSKLVRPAAELDSRIFLLELPDLDPEDSNSARFRELVGRTLSELAARRPSKVVIDIQFAAGGAPLSAVTRGLDALKDANIPIFLAMDTNASPRDLDPEVYDRSFFAGVGHTELRLGAGLAFFQRVTHNPVTGKTLDFLPTLLLADVADLQSLPEAQVIGTPRVGERALGRPLSEAPASMAEKIVIVASSERECRTRRTQGVPESVCRGAAGSHEWSGPELLAWSLTDLLQRDSKRVYRPVQSSSWILVAALASAVLGGAAYAFGLRWLGRVLSPSVLMRRLGSTALAALLVVSAGLALCEWMLVQLGWLMPPTFPAIAASLAVLLCQWHARQNLTELLTTIERRASDNTLQAEVDVFISYSHAPGNGAWVEREIVAPLEAMRLSDGRSLRIFFDRDDITVGQQWFSRINLSILGSRCFLCVWSEDYMERDYCRWELDYAFPRAARAEFLFLPVARLSKEALAGPAYAQYLQTRQYVDALSRPDFIHEVRQALLRHLDPGGASLRG